MEIKHSPFNSFLNQSRVTLVTFKRFNWCSCGVISLTGVISLSNNKSALFGIGNIVFHIPGSQPYSSIRKPTLLFHFSGLSITDVVITGSGTLWLCTPLQSLFPIKICEYNKRYLI